ncbi:hypothetical protein Tco_1384168 [Tanacetum coccineum]
MSSLRLTRYTSRDLSHNKINCQLYVLTNLQNLDSLNNVSFNDFTALIPDPWCGTGPTRNLLVGSETFEHYRVGGSGFVYRVRTIISETLVVTKIWPAAQSEGAFRSENETLKAEWEVRSVQHSIGCGSCTCVGRSPDERNAAYTSSIVSMHQPTSWQPPNHEGCGCNAQGAPPRGLGEVRPTDHHPLPGPTKTTALQAYLTACRFSHDLVLFI